jgi:hypothetical protein
LRCFASGADWRNIRAGSTLPSRHPGVPKTISGIIVDHSNHLEERIADRGADESETPLFQHIAEGIGFLRGFGDLVVELTRFGGYLNTWWACCLVSPGRPGWRRIHAYRVRHRAKFNSGWPSLSWNARTKGEASCERNPDNQRKFDMWIVR